jgi:hypothetical protein
MKSVICNNVNCLFCGAQIVVTKSCRTSVKRFSVQFY